jgi:ABC-type glycerol-3-phosphate transport system permease component
MAQLAASSDLTARRAQASRRARVRRAAVGKALIYIVLSVGAIGVLVPFLWQVSTSLKSDAQINSVPPAWIPNPIRWANYSDAYSYLPFGIFFRNTVIVEIGVISGMLLSSTMAAYAFARLNAPFKDQMFLLVLSTMMLPGIITLIPSYVIFKDLGMVDTLWPLILPAWFSAGYAFGIFLIRQFFLGIPGELGEAATIDGSGTLGILFRIYAPLAKPAMAAITIMTFISAWHDFFTPLIFLNSEHNFTLALGINEFIQNTKTGVQTHWGLVMAASMSIVVPPLILFLAFQRFFVSGITLGGVKG